jgi:hypothetical protein
VNPFNKLLLVPLVALAIGGGVGIAAATNGGSSPAPASPPATEVKGPCDELEHATDPSCTGAQVPEDNQAAGQTDSRRGRGGDDPAEAEDQNDDNGQDADDENEIEDENEVENEDEDIDDDQGEEQGEDNSGPSDNAGPGSHDSSDDSGSDSDDGGHSGHDGGDD